jgi:hypothetical protein
MARTISIVRFGVGCFSLWLGFASSADAAVISIYREIETVDALVELTTFAGGAVYMDHRTATDSLLRDATAPNLGVGASPEGFGADFPDYLGDFGLGSNASVGRTYGGLEINNASGYGDCGTAGCSIGSARTDIDLTFRSIGETTIRTNLYPAGGTVDAMLVDLTERTLVYSFQGVRRYQATEFDLSDHHMYRWVASGLALSPPAGDPYGDFSVSFFNRGTGDAVDFAPAPVPEPTTLGLFAVGAYGVLRRRRSGAGAGQ